MQTFYLRIGLLFGKSKTVKHVKNMALLHKVATTALHDEGENCDNRQFQVDLSAPLPFPGLVSINFKSF